MRAREWRRSCSFGPSLGYWSFDGCSTTDASGNAADLAAQGNPICSAGRFGDAWVLDGSSQYLERIFDPTFTPGARAWSVTAWVKLVSAPTTAFVVSWYRCGANPNCTTTDAALYALGLEGGQPFWNVRDDNGTDVNVKDEQVNLADDQWHFLVGTMSSGTGSVNLYVDGILRSTHETPGGNYTSGGWPIRLELGRWFRTGWGSPDYYFPGAIDEVRIYDNELDGAAVAALFTSNATTAVSIDDPLGLSIEGSMPNPSHGGPLAVAFTLPGAEPARSPPAAAWSFIPATSTTFPTRRGW